MPELPEVESLRLGLVRNILDQKIEKVEIKNEKIIAGNGTKRVISKSKTKEFLAEVTGKKILNIERRAKNLIFELGEGSGGKSEAFSARKPILLAHLKMTGQFVYVPKNKKNKISFGGHPIQESEISLPHKHTYIIFQLTNGTLYYNDVRQFGYVLYFCDKEILNEKNHFKNIGLEPFEKNFNLKYFKTEIKKYKTPIKKLLLDQKIVVGCGNIYCDEILFASSVLPTRPANKLNEKEIELIFKNIKIILKKAIESGGSSIANYLLADGSRGNYADFHKAYGKVGKRCAFPHCSGIISKETLFGRGTHFCKKHQK